jgi:zeta-carotene desaturase
MRELNGDFNNGRFATWQFNLSRSSNFRTLVPLRAPGLDNLLYSADADFSCFADLALTSPSDYYKAGEGSLMQCVLTPGDKWMPTSTEKIAEATLQQVKKLFPSADKLEVLILDNSDAFSDA